MKSKIKIIMKKIIKKDYTEKYKFAVNKEYKRKHRQLSINEKVKCALLNYRKIKIVDIYKFSNINRYIKEDVKFSNYFSCMIDFNCIVKNHSEFNHNMTPDYEYILNNSLNDLKCLYKNNAEQLLFISELEKYLDFCITKIEKSNYIKKDEIAKYLKNIKYKSCESLIEAMQRIIFFNQIFWQMGYSLCGLGRLDYILDKYYKNDIKNNRITCNDLKNIIIDFYTILNNYFEDKSGTLYGDTGQIIIIGGIDANGNVFSNDLTYAFIDALKEYNKPDPKLFLRVSEKTDKKLLEKAIDCMSTGIGSPMLSNDDVIIPKLIKFGYDKNDVWNYVTAACWEPTPCGDTIDCNNIKTINLLDSLNELFENDRLFNTVEEIEKEYYNKLAEYIKIELTNLSKIKLDNQPYLSMFIKSCRENGALINSMDIKYKNLGVTTLGIANVVNSILNIKEIVFKQQLFSLEELNLARKQNYSDEKILQILKNNNKNGYCSTNKEAIELTNRIVEFISNEFEKYTTYYGGKFKFGLSAPSYVENGRGIKASFDGRRDGEPFNVHISSSSNTYIDIMEFASNINYEKNVINGNVIDYILTPSYINNNIDKFTDYIKAYIDKGIYQLQINVIDSKTLIQAKENPELYSNLIVRVWGFSAYFNDLPEEYKELLIKRALDAERVQ